MVRLVGPTDLDAEVRALAFARIEALRLVHGESLPRADLIAPFDTPAGPTPLMAAQQGIHKPRFLEAALSFTTTPPKPRRDAPYADELGADGYLRYRYRGQDPHTYDNAAMRLALTRRVPLVYFYGTSPGWYVPVLPVYIVGDDPGALAFTVAVDDPEARLHPANVIDDVAPLRRAYVTRVTLQRLHQAAFRQRVLDAYGGSCAICRLRHGRLLEAAHIIPDREEKGVPEVPNGLALCKLHHAAFDSHILGVRPDYKIELRPDILDEVDGPMLRHGLQEFHTRSIELPRRTQDKPDRDYLSVRYDLFRRAG